MNCPHCDHSQIGTVCTRRDTVESVVRLRVCRACNLTWHTVEVELPKGAVAHRHSTGELERRTGFKRVVFS
jgi:transcriptional regulator NrdR family protein